jgi:hypothetical protein
MKGFLTRKNFHFPAAIEPRMAFVLTRKKWRDRATPLGAQLNVNRRPAETGLLHFEVQETPACRRLSVAAPLPAEVGLIGTEEIVCRLES